MKRLFYTFIAFFVFTISSQAQFNYPDTLLYQGYEQDTIYMGDTIYSIVGVGDDIGKRDVPGFVMVSNPDFANWKKSDAQPKSGSKAALLEIGEGYDMSAGQQWQIRPLLDWAAWGNGDTSANKILPGEFFVVKVNLYPTADWYIYGRPEIPSTDYRAKSEITLTSNEWNELHYLVWNQSESDTLGWKYNGEMAFPDNNELTFPVDIYMDDIVVTRSNIFKAQVLATGQQILITLGAGTTSGDGSSLPGDAFTIKTMMEDGTMDTITVTSATISAGSNSLSRITLQLEDIIYSDVAYVSCDYDSTGAGITVDRAPDYVTSGGWNYFGQANEMGYPEWHGEYVINSSIQERPNNAPTALALSNNVIDVDNAAGTFIGTLSTTDADDTDFTYTMIAGDGDDDNSLFTISNDSLYASESSFEAKSSYSVRIQTDDGSGGTLEEVFTIENTTVTSTETITAGKVMLYPNPVKNILHVRGLNNITNLSIVDVTGKQIINFPVTQPAINLPMAKLPKGIYMMILEDNDGQNSILKFIK